VREALLNAVMHRDYSPYARASHVQVRLFADRLEIISPGALYGNVTVETLEEQQSTRNRHLMRFAEDLHLVENRGSGVNTILTEMRKAALEPPVFEDTRSAFRVTFYGRHLLEPATAAWLRRFDAVALSEPQRMALAFLRHRGRITNGDYRRLNSADAATATRDMRGLVQVGLLLQHDSRRWTHYTLAEAVRRDEQLDLTPPPSSEEEAVLVYVREHGSISNAEARALLGYGKSHARRVLQEMRDRGLLRQMGQRGRWVRYELQ
jgi:ATP-dependent DNA helicase RecG